MKKFENKLSFFLEKYEPEKIRIVTEHALGKPTEVSSTKVYTDVKQLSKKTKIGSKSISTWLNNPNRQMTYAEAVIMAEALSEKYGEKITPDMLMKEIKETE